MNHTRTLGAVAALFLVTAPALAQTAQNSFNAQTRPVTPSASSRSAPTQPDALGAFGEMRASQLIGRTIYDATGESLAEINDIVVNKYDNSAAVLVGVGGFLGIGERQIAVRLSDLDMRGDRIVATTLTMSDLRRLSYQANNWAKHDRETLIGAKVAR